MTIRSIPPAPPTGSAGPARCRLGPILAQRLGLTVLSTTRSAAKAERLHAHLEQDRATGKIVVVP